VTSFAGAVMAPVGRVLELLGNRENDNVTGGQRNEATYPRASRAAKDALTVSTFSRDIAYSASPTALRASWWLKNGRHRVILPSSTSAM
jgi:hypothetical protein